MDLTPKQRNLLQSLTTDWQTPIQIAASLPKESGNLSCVNQTLKELVREGLVQANPVMFGLFRLTTDGMTKKELELGLN
ncbi:MULTISPECIES: hypothetical protein [Peribacillus]|uniref:hypothetical protein n=1 Tax=Peribacillus TaxID=2675229 RepID=UPI001F4DDA7F|nr:MULTISPECIES: hypothetical protein [unclassified Peribacillus]MCK1982742.1 hypothetical protein [Peribacillus sp. Aquil_B1]MCK2010328.1 hypothetical protein [Peribacillus sp. Aquil_B8]